MSKILVTGATGFVGVKVCDVLRSRGANFIAAVRNGASSEKIAVGDLTEKTDWTHALAGCDAIIHLAARVHVMNDKSIDPLMSFRQVNFDATLNFARQAAASGVKRFVFVSSIKVNGEETTDSPFGFCDTPAPLDPYGVSKLEAEQALLELSLATGLEIVVVRPPLVYGPNVRANFLSLLRLVKMGFPLPLGAIHNRRSMVAVDNLADLLIVCCRHPNAAGQVFMVSDDYDISISQLLRMLSAAMGKRSLSFPVPAWMISTAAALLGKSAMASRLLGSLQVDINHTKTTLGWKPVISMQEAIDETVAYFLAHH